MNSKGHLTYSLLKSVLRIIGGLAAIFAGEIIVLGYFIVIAEILGIFEELVDER